MEKNHSREWEILRFQEKKHKRERAVLISIIMVLLIVNLVLANIVWSSRHNNETASANSPEIQTAAVMTAPIVVEKINRVYKRCNKKDWVSDVCMT